MIENVKAVKKIAEQYLGNAEALQSPELSNEIREDVKKINVADIARGIREIHELLGHVDERITQEKSKYGMESMDREAIEISYALKMDLLYHLAFGIHPLTSYGKKCLFEATRVRHEFEEMVGGYTTRITPKNISVFTPVLSEDMAEDIITGRREAIGAIRAKGKKTYGAGILVYYLDSGDSMEDSILRIEWLYVHPDFRGRRIADSLIAEIVYQMQKNNISAITASLVAGDSWEPVMGSVFSRWKFMFGAQMEPDTIVSIGDVRNPDAILELYEKYGKFAVPLSKINNSNLTAILERELHRNKYRGYLWGQTKSPTYFNRDLSCYIGNPGSPDGLLMVHKAPSDTYRVEYMSLGAMGDKPLPAMAGHLFGQSLNLPAADVVLDIPVMMDEFDNLIEKLVPQKKSALLVTAVLSNSFIRDDIDEDAIEALLSHSDEESAKA